MNNSAGTFAGLTFIISANLDNAFSRQASSPDVFMSTLCTKAMTHGAITHLGPWGRGAAHWSNHLISLTVRSDNFYASTSQNVVCIVLIAICLLI